MNISDIEDLEKRRQEASFDLWHGHGAKMKTSKPKNNKREQQ
jgi:hypothetical protein